LQHHSIIDEPERTTCKYLHRKDLPLFAVDEGLREHASEYALFSELATLDTQEKIARKSYSEKYTWDNGSYDPVTQAAAQYFKIKPAWGFIQSFSGGLDGRRSLAHASLIRRYLQHCGTWVSSYRLILGMLQEIDSAAYFRRDDLVIPIGVDVEGVEEEARWDVLFCRLSSLQEYGWHAGVEELMWASDTVKDGLIELNWKLLSAELGKAKRVWTEVVIEHAKNQRAFFVSKSDSVDPDELYEDEPDPDD